MNSNHASLLPYLRVFLIFNLLVMLLYCKKDEKYQPSKTISYTVDGRNLKLSDASPIVIDLGSDGRPDFTVFLVN